MHRDRNRRRWMRRTPHGNFLWMRSWRLKGDGSNREPIESHGVLIPPDDDGDYYSFGILPDQRSPELAIIISLELKVSGDVTRHELGNHLRKMLGMLLQNEAIWAMLTGGPLDGPRSFTVRSNQALGGPQGAHGGALPSLLAARLAALRERLALRLAEQRQALAFPLRGHTLEALCEVLVMVSCGQDIMRLVDRNSWRWQHTVEELRVAEATFGAECQALSALAVELSQTLGTEHAVERLFWVFVEGLPSDLDPLS